MKTKKIATIYAVLAAALYAINVPLSKLLLQYAEPTMMAAFLYLGAGVGLFLYGLIEKFTGKKNKREHIHTHEHSHGDTVHTHSHSHIHSHLHVHDGNSENHKHKHTLKEHNHTHSNAEVTL